MLAQQTEQLDLRHFKLLRLSLVLKLRPSRPLRHFLQILFVTSFLMIWLLTDSLSVDAVSQFSDSYTDQTHIAQSERVSVDASNGQITLQNEANSLTDSETTLLTHLGSDPDVTSPAIGTGGTATGITYTTGSGGHSGEAAIISGTGHNVTFPVSNNFNLKKGTIDFWLSFSNWSLDGSNHTPDYPNEETILFATDANKQMWLERSWNGKIQLRFYLDSGEGVYSGYINAYGFAADSWHHITLSWNIEEDTPYVAAWLDGSELDELADPSPNTFDINTAFNSFNPATLYIGSMSDGSKPLNGKIDELRITSSEYSTTSYPGKAGVVTSTSIDTGVSSPVWGKISWGEMLPSSKTDIELQTSVSDDGSNWTNWFLTDNGVITVTFDDGYAGVYNNAFPVMNTFGYTGVPYIVTNWVGTTKYMTVAQIQALNDAGWEIGSHTESHMGNPSASELTTSHQWLVDHGFGHVALAYPYGNFDQPTIERAVDAGYTTGRTIINGYQTYNTKYRLYSYPGNSGVADVNQWLDSIMNKKAWGILTFHTVGEPSEGGNNVSTADFTAIMQHISDSRLDVLNMEDALTRIAMYTENSGDQILSTNKKYIRYRAILHSFDGATSPTLSSVKISAPTKIYKDIATTVSADGNFDHAIWPQTTDTAINNLTVTPNEGSVTVTVDTWNSSGTYYKKWTETASSHNVITSHTIGDLAANSYYNVKKNGSNWNTYRSSDSGEITFNYTEGYSTVTFEVEQGTTSGSTANQSTTSTRSGCNEQTPASAPDLFQIDRTSSRARLYFAPAIQPYDQYVVAYGVGDRTEQFGVQFPVQNATGVIDYTINALEPNTPYAFKIRAGNGCAVGEWSNVMKIDSVGNTKRTFYRVGDSSGGDTDSPSRQTPLVQGNISTSIQPLPTPKVKERPLVKPRLPKGEPSDQPPSGKRNGNIWQWFLNLFR